MRCWSRILARTNIGDRPSLRKRLGGSTVMILTVCVNGQGLVLESRAGWVINYFSAWLSLRRRYHLKSDDASKLFLTSKYIWKIFVSSLSGGLVAFYSYQSLIGQGTCYDMLHHGAWFTKAMSTLVTWSTWHLCPEPNARDYSSQRFKWSLQLSFNWSSTKYKYDHDAACSLSTRFKWSIQLSFNWSSTKYKYDHDTACSLSTRLDAVKLETSDLP